MATFSKVSEERLRTCHEDIQAVCRAVIHDFDFSVLCGYRGEEEQNAAYSDGKSRLRYPASAHNKKPSRAVDLAPYPIDWNDEERFHELAGRILETAALMGIVMKWGGHWKTFKDMPHFEIPELQRG
jgi:peptidoglycan L-alanyl-D-glutamate endopeptidase CwlK